MEELQHRLEGHDANNWRHPAGFETDRHNVLHVAKTAGRIAAHVEAIDDRMMPADTPLDPALIADLLIEGLRFLNNHNLDGEAVVADRLQQLHERFAHSAERD